MTTHQEWLNRWADRWVRDANAEVQRRQAAIAELRQAVAGTADESERDWYESLIEQHQSIIDSIRQSHRQWQRCAKRRRGLDMPELTEGLT
jgi:hypothetical protein